MKCRNSAFNAQGSKLIIVVAQVGVARTCEAAVDTITKKESQSETQFITKIDGFLSFPAPLSRMEW
jgi:hypothetical protein